MKRNILMLLFILCAVFSLIACQVVPAGGSESNLETETESYQDTESESQEASESQSEEQSSEPEGPKKYQIRLYSTEDEYTSVEYEAGQTVDVGDWPVPQSLTYEGQEVPFKCWQDEWQENDVSGQFTMPEKSMAFYATYNWPQMFSWAYDSQNDDYTSTKAGIRPFKNVDKAYYGKLSVKLGINVVTTTGIGIIWNLDYGTGDYLYDTDCEYWYFHLNPTNGGFQLSKVKNDYIVMHTVGLTASPQKWQDDWGNWRISGGTLEALFEAEFTPQAITLYIQGEKLYTYTAEQLNTVLGNSVGVRTNTAGNTAYDVEFTPYEEYKDTYIVNYVNSLTEESIERRLVVKGEDLYLPNVSEEGYAFMGWYDDKEFTNKVEANYVVTEDITIYAKLDEVQTQNGYNVYKDGSYESTVANATATVDGLGTKYGKWSTDITVTNTANNRLGILINAKVPSSTSPVLYGDKGIYGYYVHHNVKANVNFTLTTISAGTYQGRPDGTKGNLLVKSYDANTTGKLAEYRAKNADFVAGKTSSLTFNLAIEKLNTYIKVYVDGECIIEYTTEDKLAIFDQVEGCTGVGFTTATAGTTFSNYSFTPMEAIQEEPKETSKNGYTISADGKTYTSTEAYAAATVDGITGRYGKWSTDVTFTDKNNTRAGLFINATVPTSDSLIKYDNKAIKCYYLHHNVKANANFTLTTINEGIYQGRPDGSKKNIQVVNYTAETQGKLGEYHVRNADFHSGKTESLTVNLGMEVTPTYIKIYVDGECIYTCENEADLGLFDGDANCIGVGFNTRTAGTTFTNFVFTPYSA